eukprot:COSAG03_NODE_27635_length_252_cov_0.660131_1_plen_20_part_10
MYCYYLLEVGGQDATDRLGS